MTTARRRSTFELRLLHSRSGGIQIPSVPSHRVRHHSQGSRTRSPLSIIANVCRLLMGPSGEYSRAGRMYHNLIVCRSELGVAKPRFGRCSPRASLVMPGTWMPQARVSARHLRLYLFPVTKHCCRLSRETASSDGPKNKLFWSHPCHSPRLRRYLVCMCFYFGDPSRHNNINFPVQLARGASFYAQQHSSLSSKRAVVTGGVRPPPPSPLGT